MNGIKHINAKPEELLAHTDFVRRLARSLVVDENTADDIEQQTWLTVIENPPVKSSVKSWLSRVVRNFAYIRHRSENTRYQREKAVAKNEIVYSTEDVVQQEELRRKVVETVLSLQEPYRSAILFRYFQCLAPREISTKLGVPLATIKSRIQRGLKLLRQKLDFQYGCRKKWIIAFVPLAGLELSASSTAVTAGSSFFFTGAIAMTLKTKIVIALVVLIGITLTLYLRVDRPTGPVASESEKLNSTTSLVKENSEKDTFSSSSSESDNKRILINSTKNSTFLKGCLLSRDKRQSIQNVNIEVKLLPAEKNIKRCRFTFSPRALMILSVVS